MKWVIQDNLYNEDGYVRFIEALDNQKQDYEVVKVVPFAHELIPDIDLNYRPILVMGSDSLIAAAQKKNWYPGAFTNPVTFHQSMWNRKLGINMLNYDAQIVKFGDVRAPNDSEEFFIRPALDFKIFAGTVIDADSFEKWQEKAVAYGDTLNADTEVVIASPKVIYEEYRFFVVNFKIVTASRYKIGNRVKPDTEVPSEAVQFVTDMTNYWNPDIAYVIDVAKTPKGFKVIEYNCINASGFYACDCEKIVSALYEQVRWLK
jgi:hypothetical protein